MKAIVLIFVFVFSISIVSAQEKSYSDKELLQMTIFELCDALSIPKAYNDRYIAIIIPLCEEGILIFDGSLNPYVVNNERMLNSIEELDLTCYYYVGSTLQNAKLVRNIVKNRHLIKDGKLVENAAKKWVIVD